MDTMVLDNFITLFRGRGDVYGHEEGKCVKEPLTRDIFVQHLEGVAPIGVYPMVPRNGEHYVIWGCSDIDIEDFDGAKSIRDALASAGVFAWIEKSRSKGYHVWVFADHLVPAISMRHMFLAAHQVANYPAREVNPKQVKLLPHQYGNYVRLPYPNYLDRETNRRRIIDDEQNPLTLERFMDLALSNRVSVDTVARLASYYQPPATTTVTIGKIELSESLQEALYGLSPLGKVIWRDGPLEGRDRSSTLAKLAHECARSSMSPSATKVVLIDADMRWGKYMARPNGEMEIDKLVSRAFSEV